MAIAFPNDKKRVPLLNKKQGDNMKRLMIGAVVAAMMMLAACVGKHGEGDKSAIDVSQKLPGDKMIYGLACDGCNDSVIVFLPNEGGDPVTYNIVGAMKKKQVFGHPEIGDWLGLMLNPEDTTEATLVIDLDQLKGTWTYQVLPTLRESNTKSEGQIIAELTDSMRKQLFIPREYGFTLKRHHQATTVGMVRRTNSLTDDDLVEYPPVPRYSEWYSWNGKLILKSDTVDSNRKPLPPSKIQRDTMTFVMMEGDSLVLRKGNQVIGFHRQESAMTANKKAVDAAIQKAKSDSIR